MNIIFADTETGGLSPTQNSLLTVGLVAVDKLTLETIATRYIKIKHKSYNVQPKAMEINKIILKSHDADPESVTPEVARHLVSSFVVEHTDDEKPQIAGHNINFDINFLNTALNNVVSENFYHGSICTKVIVDFERKKGKLPGLGSSSLEKVAGYFGESYDAHNALADAIMSLNIYKRLLRL